MSKKTIYTTMLLIMASLMMTMLCGCDRKSGDEEIDAPDPNDALVSTSEPSDSAENEAGMAKNLSDEQALSAIKNYCYLINPDLEDLVNAEEYPVYWDIFSSEEDEIVVLFRSYTGAQNRYYIDRITGNTYVAEFVPGITDEEQQTGESFNARDYLSED